MRKTFGRLAAALAILACAGSASAQSIIDNWNKIETPAAPELKNVQIDPKTTALLMLDFMNQNCGERPRCVATLPGVQKLLDNARDKGLAIVYTLIANTTPADVMKAVAPREGEPSVLSGPDKFIGTELEAILKRQNAKTVIVVGTAANGAVLHTGSAAAFRGLSVVVPVDGMSAADPFAELYTAWHFANAPLMSQRATVTTLDMIKF